MDHYQKIRGDKLTELDIYRMFVENIEEVYDWLGGKTDDGAEKVQYILGLYDMTMRFVCEVKKSGD